MKKILVGRTLIFGAILSLSAHSLSAQPVTDSKNKADITSADEVATIAQKEPATVGKEIPVPGGMLFITPAERASMQKEISTKEAISDKEKRRQRRMKKQDRKEVTQIIGNSVNTYLSNSTAVNSLQRF